MRQREKGRERELPSLTHSSMPLLAGTVVEEAGLRAAIAGWGSQGDNGTAEKGFRQLVCLALIIPPSLPPSLPAVYCKGCHGGQGVIMRGWISLVSMDGLGPV
jgi:hypothetical protein